jgi:hydroxymethylpyrimidine pyrophosphatase-like HAD family hydrolase
VRAVTLRCVYTDLDGTLLGRGASLFRDGEGGFTLLGARALEACFRADVEVVPVSGRRRATLHEDARLLGASAYVYELGGGMVVDGEDTRLAGEALAADGRSAHDVIEESGAPRLLLERYAGRLEYHEPWHTGREVTHLMRGLVDVEEANGLLAEAGHDELRLVDNGAISPKPSLRDLPAPPHAYHLLPRSASKAGGVTAHMRARGYTHDECIAVGDSREDLGMADAVARFFLVASALERDPELQREAARRPNAELTEAGHGDGFYEAVVRAIAEGRTAWRVAT